MAQTPDSDIIPVISDRDDHETFLNEEEIPFILSETEYERLQGVSTELDQRSELSDVTESDIVLTESYLERSERRRPQWSEQWTGSYASSEAGSSSVGMNRSEETKHLQQPRRSLFQHTRGFGPPRMYTNYQTDRGRGRHVKYGFRELGLNFVRNATHEQIFDEIVHRFMTDRVMFAENEREAVSSWFRRPTAQVTKAKKKVAYAFGIEMLDKTNDFECGYLPFTTLVRFIVIDCTMEIDQTSVVVAFGGRKFPTLPKSFQLGERYQVTHFSFSTDRMCRFAGFAEALGSVHFLPDNRLESAHKIKNLETRENRRGHQFLRFETQAARPAKPEVESDFFEFWEGVDVRGYIIVEKTPELMKSLADLVPDVYTQDTYRITVEPLAGGPIDVSALKRSLNEPFLLWRMVMEFSETVPMPILVERKEKYVEKIPEEPPGFKPKALPYEWKTLKINSQLAQERLDRLRAAGDPRVKMLDGPDLKPEIEARKVDVDSRRDKMFAMMNALLEQLPILHKLGFLGDVIPRDFQKKISNLLDMNDNFHANQFRKRNISLTAGLNYVSDMLVKDKTYKSLNEIEQMQPLIRLIAETMGLNATYVSQTSDVKKMLNYFYTKKLHRYI